MNTNIVTLQTAVESVFNNASTSLRIPQTPPLLEDD